MTVIEAAYLVLREAGKPLHYNEITDRVIGQGLWQTSGKTPLATVNAGISADIKHNPKSRFLRTAPGVYTVVGSRPPKGKGGTVGPVLPSRKERKEGPPESPPPKRTKRKTPGEDETEDPSDIFGRIKEHNRSARAELLDRARKGSPADFEGLVGQLLRKMGFEEVEVTPLGGDGGVDVRGDLVVGDVVRIRMAVQAKRWKANVPAPVIQQVRGSLGAHEQGLIITTSDFSRGARREAERSDASPVALMNGQKLADLLARHEVGATKRKFELVMRDAPEKGLSAAEEEVGTIDNPMPPLL